MPKLLFTPKTTHRAVYVIIILLVLSYLFNYSSGQYYSDSAQFLENKKNRYFEDYIIHRGQLDDVRVYDSLNRAFDDRKWQLKGGLGSSAYILNIALHDRTTDSGNRIEYIGLKNIYLRHDYDISITKGQFMIRSNTGHKTFHTVRYDIENSELLAPVSHSFYKVFNLIFYAFFIVVVLTGLICVVSLPLGLFSNISRGKPFAESSVLYLNFMAKTMLIMIGFLVLVNLVLVLVYYLPVKEYFYFSWSGLLATYRPYLLFTLAAFLFARAFKRGYLLQQANDASV